MTDEAPQNQPNPVNIPSSEAIAATPSPDAPGINVAIIDVPPISSISYTSPPPDRWAHRRTEPRPFALLWLLYLMASAGLAFSATGSLGIPSADVYRHATRVMFVLASLGLSIFWPMLRLSQARPSNPRSSVALDLLVLLPPLHCVLWPQLFDWMAQWNVAAVGAIAAAFTAWAFLLGGVLALALELDSSPDLAPDRASLVMRRSLWMVAFIAIVLVGPACSLSMPGRDTLEIWMLLSPVGVILEILRDRSWSGVAAFPLSAHWWAILGTSVAALIAWTLASFASLHRESAPVDLAGA